MANTEAQSAPFGFYHSRSQRPSSPKPPTRHPPKKTSPPQGGTTAPRASFNPSFTPPQQNTRSKTSHPLWTPRPVQTSEPLVRQPKPPGAAKPFRLNRFTRRTKYAEELNSLSHNKEQSHFSYATRILLNLLTKPINSRYFHIKTCRITPIQTPDRFDA